jgi:gamma-glutamyltranspeptidase/glutathione hydrolase/leukotriene-C4 hydrolase
MGLVAPESTGLGGGGWMTIFTKATGKATVINFRESAPAYAHAGMFAASPAENYGVDSIAVPGQLAGFHEAHKLFGRVPFNDLIQPTIDMARKGFPVTKHLADAVQEKIPTIRKYGSQGIKSFIKPPLRERFLQEGGIIRREDLAHTLQLIQREGRDSLYNVNGTLANMLISDLRSMGSKMTLEDLQNYSVKVEESEGRLLPNGMTFYSNNLPGSGPLLGFMLDAVMRSVNLSSKLETQEETNDFYKKAIEVMKFAFGQRSFLGDPEYEHGVNCSRHESTFETLQRISSPRFAIKVAERIKRMNKTCCDPIYYQQALGYPVTKRLFHFKPDHGTAAVTVIDGEGNAIAASTSINENFGSLVMSKSTGIIMNNQMNDFARHAAHGQHNEIAAGKRPFSSIAPAVITTGKGKEQSVHLAISASGGTKIITAEALVILKSILFKDICLNDAVTEERIRHQLQPNIVMFENNFPSKTMDSLLLFGHVLQRETGKSSSVVVINRIADGKLESIADSRKEGSVAGN